MRCGLHPLQKCRLRDKIFGYGTTDEAVMSLGRLQWGSLTVLGTSLMGHSPFEHISFLDCLRSMLGFGLRKEGICGLTSTLLRGCFLIPNIIAVPDSEDRSALLGSRGSWQRFQSKCP